MKRISEEAMVIIHEDNISPQQWHLGRMVDLIREADNRKHLVNVRTALKAIRCSIRKLPLLPIN